MHRDGGESVCVRGNAGKAVYLEGGENLEPRDALGLGVGCFTGQPSLRAAMTPRILKDTMVEAK